MFLKFSLITRTKTSFRGNVSKSQYDGFFWAYRKLQIQRRLQICVAVHLYKPMGVSLDDLVHSGGA